MTQRSTTKARASKPSQSAPAPASETKSGAPFLPDVGRSGAFDSQPMENQSLNSIIRSILLARPDFPRLYADVILTFAPNSNEARILAPHYQKIIERVKANMANTNSTYKTCTHIKVTGVRCGSPALRGEQFCYFHQRMVRGVRTPPQARLHPIALIEDEESIQSALMEVINALMRNSIDLKRAALILRALHIAVKNAQRARLRPSSAEAVTEIPDYAQPTEPQPKTEFDFPATAAPIPTEEEKLQQQAADFKLNWQAGEEALAAQAPEAKRILAEILDAKKPQHKVTTTPAPKERKSAAHRVSGG